MTAIRISPYLPPIDAEAAIAALRVLVQKMEREREARQIYPRGDLAIAHAERMTAAALAIAHDALGYGPISTCGDERLQQPALDRQ